MLKLKVPVNILRAVQQVLYPENIFKLSRPQLMCANKLFIHRQFFVSTNQFCESRITNAAVIANEESYSRPLKVLKIAIIGVPNSGKSTLINEVLNRRICSTSKKVHTTKRKSRAIGIMGDTQLVFLDTPGLVTLKEYKRHELNNSFLIDAQTSMLEADLIAVVHDLSNKWTREALDSKVLKLLQVAPNKPAILVLNKIDTLKSKRALLDLVQKLTNGRMKSVQDSVIVDPLDMTEIGSERTGWPNFTEVFMVSALHGSGVGDIKEYILMQAQPGKWIYPDDVFTDQKPREIVELAVREKLLEHLPQEIPYNIKTTLEMWEQSESGLLCIVVLAECPAKRYLKMLLGHNGARIRLIAKEAEQALANTFRCGVKLKIVVTDTQTK